MPPKNTYHRILLLLAFLSMLAILSMAVSPAPRAAASPALTATTLELFSYNGITQTTSSSATAVGAYSSADCYNYIVMGTVNTTTVSLQHSAFPSNWVSLVSFTQNVTTTNDYTNTVVHGQYMRATVTVANTSPVTGTVACVFR